MLNVQQAVIQLHSGQPSAMKKLPYNRVATVDGDKLLEFNYLIASELTPDKEGWYLVGVAL